MGDLHESAADAPSKLGPRLWNVVRCCTYIPLLALILFATLKSCWDDPTGFWKARDFDAVAWRAGSVDTRVSMVDDLLESERLIGLESAAVLDLLGAPSWRKDSVQFSAGDARRTSIDLDRWDNELEADITLRIEGLPQSSDVITPNDSLPTGSAGDARMPFDLLELDVWEASSADVRAAHLMEVARAFEDGQLDEEQLRAWRPSGRVEATTFFYLFEHEGYEVLRIGFLSDRVDWVYANKPFPRD